MEEFGVIVRRQQTVDRLLPTRAKFRVLRAHTR